MASRNLFRDQGSLTQGIVKLYGRVVLGATGAISTTTPAQADGFAIIKTAAEAGRYSVTLNDPYRAVVGVSCIIVGAADAAYTTANGLWNGLIRNKAVSTTRTFDIQFQRTDTGADAEIEDNLTFYIEITLANSTTSKITA